VRIELPAEPSADDLAEADAQIDAMWKRLQSQAREEFGAEGADVDELDFSHLAMMRYAVQLDDLEVTCPGAPMSPAAELIERFEDLYERINRRVAKYRKGGFLISEVGLFARIRTPKPVFPTVELGEREPGRAAHKGTRQMYADGEWHEAQIWEMDELRPGNVIDGPSIVEHSMTTLVVPLGMRVSMDERGFLWLSEPG
jgi:acetone carboxylase, beta subunit